MARSGRNECGLVRFGIIRKANLKFFKAFNGRFVELKLFHIGRFGRFLHECDRKAIEVVLRTFDVDRYPVERVQHPTCQVKFLCAPEDKGPKTDPLNYSFDRNIEPLRALRSLPCSLLRNACDHVAQHLRKEAQRNG